MRELARLVDELHLLVYPLTLGSGPRLFRDGGVETRWTLAGQIRCPRTVRPAPRLRRLVAGIPYYLRVEIDRARNAAEVHLFELVGDDYISLASALAGETFQTSRPFELSFDPADLLEP